MKLQYAWLLLLPAALSFAGITYAEESLFQTEFAYSQQPHSKATGRLGEGYRIRSYFQFLVPKKSEQVDWASLRAGYLAQVQPGFTHLPAQEGDAEHSARAKAMLPCDIRYIFAKAKEVQRRGVADGFDSLSSPERAVYNFSKKYIHDPVAITFNRRLIKGKKHLWTPIAVHHGYEGVPSLILSERFSSFNQFAIDGGVLFIVVPHSETEFAVYGEISLTLDADILDQRVIGLFLSLPVKASLKGLLPTKVVFNRVVDKLKMADIGSDFRCTEAKLSENSLIYGVPNFAEGYLKSLRSYLNSRL